ncbi:MAG: hypothetical protein QM642_12010 [Edaphocola sp.]
MKRIVILVTMMTLGAGPAGAQEAYNSTGRTGNARYKANQQKQGFDPKRLVFGGNLGLSFGTVTYINVAPSVGYRLTDNFAAGVTTGYSYYRESNAFQTYNLNTSATKTLPFTQSIYTGGLWARYTLFRNVMLQGQFEVNSIDFYDFSSYTFDSEGWAQYNKNRVAVPSLLLGGGYRQPIEGIGSFFIIGMYDVLQNIASNTRTDQNGNKYSISPYANRLDIRMGFLLGF